MLKCKIKSVKPIGKEETYNVTMKSKQHNYAICFDNDNKRFSVFTKNSHAAAYAFISYQEAFLKTYYPIEYMCNLLSSEIHNQDKDENLTKYLKEAERLNIVCKKTRLNRSGLKFCIEKGVSKFTNEEIDFIRMPLTILKGIGEKAVNNIVQNQPYSGLRDFLKRIDHRLVNSKVFNILVNYSCMSEWEEDKDKILKMYNEIKEDLEKEKRNKKKVDKEIEKQKETRNNDNSLFE